MTTKPVTGRNQVSRKGGFSFEMPLFNTVAKR